MRTLQSVKHQLLFSSVTSATNATAASAAIDTDGYEETKILVWQQCGATNTTDAPTTLSLQESDTTDATNFSDLSGFVGGTNNAGGFTIAATVSTTQSTVPYVFNVTNKNTKRYLRLVLTPSVTGQTNFAVAILGNPNIAPTTAAAQGASVVVNG